MDDTEKFEKLPRDIAKTSMGEHEPVRVYKKRIQPFKVKLKSGFKDYYDHMFDTTGVCYERMAAGDLSREDMFRHLQKEMGLATPTTGIVIRLNNTFPDYTPVVVYLDNYAHRGEGKILTTIGEALDNKYGTNLAALYVPPKNITPTSIRYLRIGERVFWMCYKSDDEWRSNCGNVDIYMTRPIPYMENYTDKLPLPMIAVDFVPDIHGGLLAVDYNTAPGLRGTPVEEKMSAAEVVDEISMFFGKRAYIDYLLDYSINTIKHWLHEGDEE